MKIVLILLKVFFVSASLGCAGLAPLVFGALIGCSDGSLKLFCGFTLALGEIGLLGYLLYQKAALAADRFKPVESILNEVPITIPVRRVALVFVYALLTTSSVYCDCIFLACVGRILHLKAPLLIIEQLLDSGVTVTAIGCLGIGTVLVLLALLFFEMILLNRLAFKAEADSARGLDNGARFRSLDRLTTISIYRKQWEKADEYSRELLLTAGRL